MAKYLTAMRYGLMAHVENVQTDVEGLQPGQIVIADTSRGVEWGEVSGEIREVEREVKGLGTILRVATDGDLGIIQHIRDVKEPEEAEYCRAQIKAQKLPMKLVGVEHLFSSDKIVFYFLADGRVDFRALVKDLARRYRTRIEMRQIGVRDEARVLADFEHCGRELCCRTFLRSLEPVTMRMAKMQKTTLDPSKISGHCGRLMCCLRFEDAVYDELRRTLPKKGKVVVTPQMTGEVISVDILKQTVTIQQLDGTREPVHVSEIVEVKNRGSLRGRDDDRNNRSRGRRGNDRKDNRNTRSSSKQNDNNADAGSKENAAKAQNERTEDSEGSH